MGLLHSRADAPLRLGDRTSRAFLSERVYTQIRHTSRYICIGINMNDSYLNVIQLLPQIHRQFMEVIKKDLEGIKINDINNVQSIMLFNIGDTTLSIGDLTLSGVYIGSNVSYHVKKMVENGYLIQEHSAYDRRVSHVRVTEKGRKLREELTMTHQRRIDLLADVALSSDELQAAMSVLRLLDRFWSEVAGPGRRLPSFV